MYIERAGTLDWYCILCSSPLIFLTLYLSLSLFLSFSQLLTLYLSPLFLVHPHTYLLAYTHPHTLARTSVFFCSEKKLGVSRTSKSFFLEGSPWKRVVFEAESRFPGNVEYRSKTRVAKFSRCSLVCLFLMSKFQQSGLLWPSSTTCSSKITSVCLAVLVISILVVVMGSWLRHLVTVVTSESMKPNLRRGDILISTPAELSPRPNVRIGDVVLVQVGNWGKP